MSNINLLPEEMRDKERRELIKAAKQPKVFTVDLSAAKKDQPLEPIKPSKPPKSLWSEIFGRKVKPAPVVKIAPFGQRVDAPEAINNNLKYQETYTKVKPQNNFLSSMGSSQYPAKPVSSEKIIPAKPSFELPQKSSGTQVDFRYNAGLRPKRRGFWSSFKGLFSSKTRSSKLAKVSKPEIINKPIEIPRPKPVEPVRAFKKTEEKYHTAPKAEKSKLDINLIPQELLFRKYPKNRQQIVGILLAIIIPALIIGAIYMMVDQQQRAIEVKISQLNSDKGKLIAYINGFKDIQQKNIRLQDKLLAINKLLQKHVY